MRIRHAVPLAMTLALTAACGDGAEEAPSEEGGEPSITADQLQDPAPASDTASEEAAEAGADEDEASEAMARSRALYTVQVGAFVRDDNARDLRRRLDDAGLPTWAPTAEIEGRGFERVRIGATGTVAEARRLGQRLQERFDSDVWIAPIAPEEDLPTDLVDSTRRLLEGG